MTFIHSLALLTSASLLLSGAGCGGETQPPAASSPAPAATASSSATTAAGAAPAQATTVGSAVSDAGLAGEVAAFLERWVLARDAPGALKGRTSAAFSDELFLPAASTDAVPYADKFAAGKMPPPQAMSSDAFEKRLADHLSTLVEGPPPAYMANAGGAVASLLRPFAPEDVQKITPQLWELIAERKPRPLPVAGVPELAYEVRDWQSISWTASATPGYKVELENRISKGLAVQAVVCHMRPDEPVEAPQLIVTLWSDEGTKGGTWRIFGVELPPTN